MCVDGSGRATAFGEPARVSAARQLTNATQNIPTAISSLFTAVRPMAPSFLTTRQHGKRFLPGTSVLAAANRPVAMKLVTRSRELLGFEG